MGRMKKRMKKSTRALTSNLNWENIAKSKRSNSHPGSIFYYKIVSPKRSQAGVEYMIIIGFVTFAIITTLALAYFYSGLTKDKIRLNQIENFAIQLINSAESVFFAGEPSKTTIRLFLPDGVKSIDINSDSVVIAASTSTGENRRSFTSRVPLQGSISTYEGIKTIQLQAKEDYVLVSSG